MKFGVLALDYDGTISNGKGIHPAVRELIPELNAKGIRVVLVTGRVLSDLRNDAGDLRLFDAVVAENGAVLAFPGSGRSQVLASPPPTEFLQALTTAGVAIGTGECVIEAEAAAAPRILEEIRRMDLPLVIHFNRGRLMILPQAVSKGTGLREALAALRLSVHNTAAIGDAENDHQLLEAVELGAAVRWGSQALVAVADDVVEGDGPQAVANYARKLAERLRLPPERVGRRALLLGRATADDTVVSLAVRGRNVLIAGEPRSGKSWVAGLLAEQLILHHYALFVIDPEGDYRSLERLPGVLVADASAARSSVRDFASMLRHADISLVLDLSHLPHGEKREYVKALLRWLRDHRRHTGIPHRILVDEAHYFLHDPDVLELLDLELGGYTFVTYRAAGLHAAVRAATAATIVTRGTDPAEIRALAELSGSESLTDEWMSVLGDLPLEEAVLLPGAEEAGGRMIRFRTAPRLTSHVRHLHKYTDMPVPAHRGFAFSSDGQDVGLRANSLAEFAAHASRLPPSVLEEHLRRGDVSRWIREVFGDHQLAVQVGDLESQVRLSHVLDVTDAIAQLIQERYADAHEAGTPYPLGTATEEW